MNLREHDAKRIKGSKVAEFKIFIEASDVHKSTKAHSGHKANTKVAVI